MSSQSTNSNGTSSSTSNVHTASSPRITRCYPPHFQQHQQHHFPSERRIGITAHSAITASTLPITTSLPTAVLNEGIINSGGISAALPLGLGMAPQGTRSIKPNSGTGQPLGSGVLGSVPGPVLNNVGGVLSPSGSVLASAAVSPSSTSSTSVSTGNGLSNSSIVTGLPYGIIMDRGDVNEVVGGGAEVVLGDLVDKECIEKHFQGDYQEDEEGMGSRSDSGRSSSTATIVPNNFDEGDNLIKGIDGTCEAPVENSRTQLGAWKDLRLVYAIVSFY